MYRQVVCIVTLLAVVSATKVTKCKNDAPFPREVRIAGCDNPPCDVIKGTNAEIEIDFTTANDADKLTGKVKATVLGAVTVPYPLPEDIANVCKNLLNDQECPLDADEDATYKFIFPVGGSYPEIGVSLEIYIEDQDKKVVTCFNVDIKVKK